MKKIVAAFLIAFAAVAQTNAQCVPGTSTVSGITPDSATGLSPAVVGQPYNQVMQIRVPQATTTMLGPIPLNATLLSLGLPAPTALPP